jgi:hypothetical protein
VKRLPRIAFTVAALVAMLVAVVGPTPAQAAESPVVSLGLTTGQRINKTVVVQPTIASGADVKRIMLYANYQPVASAVSAPWSLSWNTRNTVDGGVLVYLLLLDSNDHLDEERVGDGTGRQLRPDS